MHKELYMVATNIEETQAGYRAHILIEPPLPLDKRQPVLLAMQEHVRQSGRGEPITMDSTPQETTIRIQGARNDPTHYLLVLGLSATRVALKANGIGAIETR